MICEECKQGNHRMCRENDCECPRRAEKQQIGRMVNSGADASMAEMVYSNLLYGGSDVARMLTDGAGEDAVRLFVRQILRTYKAIRC